MGVSLYEDVVLLQSFPVGVNDPFIATPPPANRTLVQYYCITIAQYMYWRVGGTPLCAGAPRGVVPPSAPPAVLCAPLWWARAPCAAPPCGGFLPRVLLGPPCGVVTPTETIVIKDSEP